MSSREGKGELGGTRMKKMSLEAVRNYLDKGGKNLATVDRLPSQFFEWFALQGIHVDHIEAGRVFCSLKVSPQLSNTGNFLHGGAIGMLVDLVGSSAIHSLGVPLTSSGVSVEINITYLDTASVDDEIEIEAKALGVGKDIAVIVVELRNKSSGKVIAQGRHTKYLPVKSKM